MQTINPTLAKEWNYEKNGGLTPIDITPGSNKKVWWKCGQGHEWQAFIYNRNKGNGCPECHRNKKIVISNMINYMYNLGDGNYVNSSIK